MYVEGEETTGIIKILLSTVTTVFASTSNLLTCTAKPCTSLIS